jgi:A/G-specific adenine glycosylase
MRLTLPMNFGAFAQERFAAVAKEKRLTVREVNHFQETIYRYFFKNGRSLPWRETHDPYRILVSEIMLQQTQVERVAGKYEQFIAQFPDFTSLAQAPLREILAAWQGLGYNRRALNLRRLAQRVAAEYQGQLPDSSETLRTFPGIGEATAGALVAFAYQQPAVFIETNIRRTFIHFFFADRQAVKDKEILPLIGQTLDRTQVRTWYYALMDYGAMLKKVGENPNHRSAHHSRQAPFRDSDRQIRGLILRTLLERPVLATAELVEAVGKSPERLLIIINQLVHEGFLDRQGNRLSLSSGS